MKKAKGKQNNKKQKNSHTLYDFLPKDVIDDFLEYRDDPEAKKEYEEACDELDDIFEYCEDHLDREMTKSEHQNFMDIISKHSPKNKDGDIYTFLQPETVWEIYRYELGEKLDFWENFLNK